MTILAAGLLKGPDYFILVGYFVLMLGIGAYFYRFMRGMKDYFSGGNRIPWWLSGVSFYMTSFSAYAFITYSALAYSYGWVGITLLWLSMPATMVSVTFFAKRWRRARIDSPVEYLETRYSPIVRQLFAWHGVPVRVFDDSLKLIAVGTFVSVGLKLPMRTSMLVSGGIMLAYTLMGGLWAVTVTDFVQFIVLSSAIVILLPLAIVRAGGLAAIVHNSPPGFFHLTSPQYNWVYICSQLLLASLCFSALHWQLVQRYYCVPTERDAQKVGWLVVVLYFIGPPLMFFPPLAARQFVSGLTKDTEIYPTLCAHLLAPGMLGLMIAAMFSSTMSALSGDYNVCANVLTTDVYRRLLRPQASQRELVHAGRLMTVLVGALSITLALAMAGGGSERLFRNMVKLFSTAAAPVAIPMLLGLTWPRATNRGVLTGFAAGLSTGLILLWRLPDQVELLDLHWKKENLILICTVAATAVPAVLVSLAQHLPEADRKRIAAFHERLRMPIGSLPGDIPTSPTAREPRMSPFRIVGICILLIGGMMLAVTPWVADGLQRALTLGLAGLLLLSGALLKRQSRVVARQEAAAALATDVKV
jgi:solute:Na+ symporter, SSS family